MYVNKKLMFHEILVRSIFLSIYEGYVFPVFRVQYLVLFVLLDLQQFIQVLFW